MAAAVRRPAHRLDVTAGEAAVAKGLRALRTADARQPTANVVAVGSPQRRLTVVLYGSRASELVVAVAGRNGEEKNSPWKRDATTARKSS